MLQNLKESVLRYLLTALLALFAANAAAQSPNDVVDEAAKLLDQQLKDRKVELEADKDALYALINEILLPRFDRRYAAQQVLGKNWRTASAEQRERFVEAFYNSLLRKYSEGVLEFNLSRIEILPFRGDLTKKRVSVKTMVRLDDGTRVPVNYTMINRDPDWLIFDVVIEGISYVITFRTEMKAEIQRTSLDAVIARLESDASTMNADE